MNPDNMRKDSLEELIPTYLAFTEDKLLQAIMREWMSISRRRGRAELLRLIRHLLYDRHLL